MGCKINTPNTQILFKFPTKRAELGGKSTTFCPTFSIHSQNQDAPTISTTTTNQTQIPKSEISTLHFKTLRACKLGISRYPDFEYNAEGGTGTASAETDGSGDQVSVSFDVGTLYIPPLTTETTKFLGLPLPPFLKIDILPEFFHGNISKESGKVELEFKAKFIFSVGSIYKAPPLLVKTVLTSEESEGSIRRGKGERLDKEGKCRLVGVATVDPIDDFLLNSFLSLPTECIAILNAIISFS
ncbi:uncharacterized protein LOC111011473 [Momordica charantia]|uniref:Uncharacterized protein LOC111011473 n=1 Tax=Momordica charantia TaxID=3673 RepID=A0A6J1CIF5_MOMCH|nr:uncharacterized protein LOC111011473 [Momordica charantia]